MPIPFSSERRNFLRNVGLAAAGGIVSACVARIVPTEELIATPTSRDAEPTPTSSPTLTPKAEVTVRPTETTEPTVTPEATATLVPISPEYRLDGPEGFGGVDTNGEFLSEEQRVEANKQWGFYKPYIEKMIEVEQYSGFVGVDNPTGIVAAVRVLDDGRVVVYPKVVGGEKDGIIILPMGAYFDMEGIKVPEMPQDWDPSQVTELSKGNGERAYYDDKYLTFVRADGGGNVFEAWNHSEGRWVTNQEIADKLEVINALEDADKIRNLPIGVAVAAWLKGDKINVEGMGMKDTPEVSEANFSFGEARKYSSSGSSSISYFFPGLELGNMNREGVRYVVLGVARKNTIGDMEYGVILVDPANSSNQNTCSQKPEGVIETYSITFSGVGPNNLDFAEKVFDNIGKIILINITTGFDPDEMIEKLATGQDFSVIDEGELFNDPGLSEEEQRLLKGYAKLNLINLTDPAQAGSLQADEMEKIQDMIHSGGKELETFLFQYSQVAVGVMNGLNEIAAWVAGEPVVDVTGLIAKSQEDINNLDNRFFNIYGLCVVK